MDSGNSQPALIRRIAQLRRLGGMHIRPHGLVIGRQQRCTIVLDDPTVSRQHAVLRREHDRWILQDLGSTNGTRVNGVRVRGEVAIEPGDELGFGAAVIRFAPGGRRLFGRPRAEEARGIAA